MHELSEQELRVARLLAEVKTLQEIADEMGVSRRTVKMYTERMRLKLQVERSRDIPRTLKELGVI